MILRPQLEPTDHQSVLDYYKEHYDEVHIITCNQCGNDLGIEIRGEVSGYKTNDLGFTVLGLGDNLLSSRVRLDGSMGYQCGAIVPNPEYPKAVEAAQASFKAHKAEYDDNYAKQVKAAKKEKLEVPAYLPPVYQEPDVPQTKMCLNDTRGTKLEEVLSPNGTFLPHEVHAIKQKQVELGWKPKIKHDGNKEIHETFTRERIK